MSRNLNRDEAIRIAAEKLRRKQEKEKREEQEFFTKISTGRPWMLFKVLVGFCTLMVILTTIETFVDGETKKIDDSEWRIDRELYIMWHQSVKVGDDLFVPHLRDFSRNVKGSFEITYSPIFRTGKKLSYDVENGEYGDTTQVRRHEEIRRRSIFTWFPFLQILMLIPLLTFFLKSPKPYFNFLRVASMVIVLPGTLLVIFLTLL